MRLSILCVTRGDARALPFLKRAEDLAVRCSDAELVVAVDGADALPVQAVLRATFTRIFSVRSAGFVESVLDAGVAFCKGDYILRLDDDERVSPRLASWLRREDFLAHEHWRFRRGWLWPDQEHYLDEEPHWPDWQTRLSVKEKAGGRTRPHEASPFGPGVACAHGAIEHHKLLVWNEDERRELVRSYDGLVPGVGHALRRFYVPAHDSHSAEWLT